MKRTIVFIFLCLVTHAIAQESVSCRNLLVTYDIVQLEAELRLVEDKYLPRIPSFDNWVAIPLRNATGTETQEGLELSHSVPNQKMLPCINTPLLEQLPYIASILEDIAQRFEAEVGLVRISKVRCQRKIAPHKDGQIFDIDKGTIYRLHIPIITGENVIFDIENKRYHLEPGNLYFTNVSKTHSVVNNGSFDRVHIIIDVQANSLLHKYIMESPELIPNVIQKLDLG